MGLWHPCAGACWHMNTQHEQAYDGVGTTTNDECSWQAKYSKTAGSAREIFAEFDPDYESYTLDEAYLDVTDHAQLHSMSGTHLSPAAHTWTSVGHLSGVVARPLQKCICAKQDAWHGVRADCMGHVGCYATKHPELALPYRRGDCCRDQAPRAYTAACHLLLWSRPQSHAGQDLL